MAVALTSASRLGCRLAHQTTTFGWVVSPAFDLLFFANIAWLLLLLPGITTESSTAIEFWQLYFLTLPHRWLTLIVVIADPDRREHRTGRLVAVAGVALIVIVGVWLLSGSLTCLAMIDYVWNGWHFAAQHHGVTRLYSRKYGGGPDWLERWGIRGFVTYAVFRTAGWSTGWLEATNLSLLRTIDLVVLMMPLTLFLNSIVTFQPQRLGRLIYLTSVCLLYSGIIVSLSLSWRRGVVALVTAASLFHSVEYLAFVTHYARRRLTIGSEGWFRLMARYWLPLLGVYLVLLGSFGAMMESPRSRPVSLWLGANLWAAFVHYAFDGMIWKMRRPATAHVLGV